MNTPTFLEILKTARWGDYQKEDGTWAIGIANQPELIQAISAAMKAAKPEKHTGHGSNVKTVGAYDKVKQAEGYNLGIDKYESNLNTFLGGGNG